MIEVKIKGFCGLKFIGQVNKKTNLKLKLNKLKKLKVKQAKLNGKWIKIKVLTVEFFVEYV